MTHQRRTTGGKRAGSAAAAVAAVVAGTGAVAPAARGVSWWLPPNYATHGESMDSLFNVIFWLTTVVMVGTVAAMLYFMV
jgi:hypothetical protein